VKILRCATKVFRASFILSVGVKCERNWLIVECDYVDRARLVERSLLVELDGGESTTTSNIESTRQVMVRTMIFRFEYVVQTLSFSKRSSELSDIYSEMFESLRLAAVGGAI
jgi:hypothetical protein